MIPLDDDDCIKEIYDKNEDLQTFKLKIEGTSVSVKNPDA